MIHRRSMWTRVLSRSVSSLFPVLRTMAVDTTQRLVALREEMARAPGGPVKAYIVPSEDAHQSEYIADVDKRREYISGFTGSAGTAIVTDNDAALWTDGRYFNQAVLELDVNWKLMKTGLPNVLSQASRLIVTRAPMAALCLC